MFKVKHIFFFLIVLAILCLIATDSDNFLIQAQINKKQIFYLKVVTDKHFRYCYKWQELIRDIIEKGSKELDSQLGIRFEIKEFEELETTRANGSVRIYWLARHVDSGDCDFVVCFSGERLGGSAGWANSVPGRYTLITYINYSDDPDDPSTLLDYFVHEMGHLLGAKHVKDLDSIMSGGENWSLSLKFDEKSKRRILKNKWRNFKELKIKTGFLSNK